MFHRLLLFLTLTVPLFAQDGGPLFTLYCSACHGADGKGATGGTFPPLAGSPWVAGDPDRAVKIVLHGLNGPVNVLGTAWNLEMPPQGAVLNDDQIAAILTFVRSSWGNQAGPVTAGSVKAIRAANDERRTPWTSAEILKLHPLPLEKTALSDLISQTYQGAWKYVPEFKKLKAVNIEEEHDGIISVQDSPFKTDFGMVWEAKLEIPADGDYLFYFDVDDSGKVFIDDELIVEIPGIGPLNGSRAQKSINQLTKGSHRFRVEYVQYQNGKGIVVGWKHAQRKEWSWLTDEGQQETRREPIPVEPVNDRPVIYRNFITGTTLRSIGVGFPGGLNLAYSADHFAPELIWTGKFIDGSHKWTQRGTANNPPAGENVVNIGVGASFKEARFLGYKLDPAGNPAFRVQIGDVTLSDSWKAGSAALVRTLSLAGTGTQIVVFGHQLRKQGRTYTTPDDKITIDAGDAEIRSGQGSDGVVLGPDKPATLIYRWKKLP